MISYAILGLIGILVYLVMRRPAAEVPDGTEKNVLIPEKDTRGDTSGKHTSYDNGGNPVVLDPVSKDYIPPPKGPLVPGSTVEKTPTTEVPVLLPERTGPVAVGDPVVRADPGAPAGRRVITTSEANAYRAEKEGIAVYEPPNRMGMRSYFLTADPGSWMNRSPETVELYALMYGEGYRSKLHQTGKVAENMAAKNVVPHRTIRPPDRRAQHFVYDGAGNEVIWDEHLQKVLLPAA